MEECKSKKITYQSQNNIEEKMFKINKKVESPSNFSRMCDSITAFTRFGRSIEDLQDFNYNSPGDDDLPTIHKEISVSIVINITEDTKNKNKKSCDQTPKIFTIRMNVNNFMYKDSIIKTSIDAFNDYFEAKKEDYRLILTSNNYNLRPSKKNGKPNTDYPCIDKDSSIIDTGIFKLAFIYKEQDLIRIQKKKNCQKCSIF